jgi:hypothetical protein
VGKIVGQERRRSREAIEALQARVVALEAVVAELRAGAEVRNIRWVA